jgi:hypothetical protein
MSTIKIHVIGSNKSKMNISPANVKRGWMSESNNHAYSCIPLTVANQYGWICHAVETFTATWDGGYGVDSVKIESSENLMSVSSHFGNGILTLLVDFIIETPPNTSIYVRGITNSNKTNIYPLDGIVETDWLPFTFTMNYKFHTPGSVTFEKGEPIFMFFPIEISYIESFKITESSISKDSEFMEKYKKYQTSRKDFMQQKKKGKQGFYVSGKIVDEKQEIPNHKVKLNLDNPNIN